MSVTRAQSSIEWRLLRWLNSATCCFSLASRLAWMWWQVCKNEKAPTVWEQSEIGKASWGLHSELTHCPFCCILLVWENYKASLYSRDRENSYFHNSCGYSVSWWEELQSACKGQRYWEGNNWGYFCNQS